MRPNVRKYKRAAKSSPKPKHLEAQQTPPTFANKSRTKIPPPQTAGIVRPKFQQ